MGEQASAEVLQQYKGRILSSTDPRSIQVERVAHRLIAASGLDVRTRPKLTYSQEDSHVG